MVLPRNEPVRAGHGAHAILPVELLQSRERRRVEPPELAAEEHDGQQVRLVQQLLRIVRDSLRAE